MTAQVRELTPSTRSVLVDSVRRRKRDFRRLAGWSLLEALPVFLSGLLVARALNSFIADDLGTGLAWLALFAGSVLVGVWGTRQTFLLLADVVEPFRDDLVTGVVRGAMQRSTSSDASPHTPDVARLSEQVEIVREAYAAVLMITQQFVVIALSAMLGLLALAPVVLLLVGPPLLVAVAVFLVALRRIARWQQASIFADEELAEGATRLGSGMRDVAACGAQDMVFRDLDSSISAHADATRALGRLDAVGTLAIAVGSWVPLLLTLGFGPRLVAGGASAGVVVGAATYILQGLQPALQTLVHGLSGPGQWLFVALGRVVDTMGPTPEAVASSPDPAVEPRGALSLRSVTFAYSAWAAPVVDRLELTVQAADHVAIVGPSGAGKSTLAAVMAGLLTPSQGHVRLGGVDLTDLSPSALARTRVLIPQEAYVFDGSVRENLAYLDPDVSQTVLNGAVDRLGARGLVQRLGGYDAMVDATMMSAGERQLLTLVRAYVSPAPMVILDEATCHLDPRAEALVERAFAERAGSMVVIAHRMSSALRADKILLMDGATVRLGSNDELLASSSLYRDLVGHWRGDDAGTA